MTRGGRFQAFAIVGLTVVSLGVGSRAIVMGPQPVAGGDRTGIEVSSIDLAAPSPVATFQARGMVPGDTAKAVITIANPTGRPMGYSMSHGPVPAGGAAFAAALVLTIRTVGSSCNDFDGTVLYDGPLDEAAIGRLGGGRQIPAATAEILCFQALLPIEAGNELQGATTGITLAFNASSRATF